MNAQNVYFIWRIHNKNPQTSLIMKGCGFAELSKFTRNILINKFKPHSDFGAVDSRNIQLHAKYLRQSPLISLRRWAVDSRHQTSSMHLKQTTQTLLIFPGTVYERSQRQQQINSRATTSQRSSSGNRSASGSSNPVTAAEPSGSWEKA